MEIGEKTLELKEKVIDGVYKWMDDRIDLFLQNNPALAPAGKYLKRGVANLMIKEDSRLEKGIDTLMLFIADENGNYDMGMLFDDALSMFKSMPEMPFDIGLLHGTIGAGTLRIQLPENPVISLLMGNIGAIKLNEEDFKELKNVLVESN